MLGKVIKEYCEAKNISQAQFADSIGISDRALRYFIAGLKIPQVITLKRISILTGVSMDELTKDVG